MSYQTEEEQLAVISQFWKKYSNKIIIALLIITAFVYGFRTWKEYKKSQEEEASALYQQIEKMGNVKKSETTKKTEEGYASLHHLVSLLQDKYPHSIYTQYASLLYAKEAVIASKFGDAKRALNHVRNRGSDEFLKKLATIRLAHIMINDGTREAGEAVELLNKLDNKGVLGVYIADTLGDAYVSLDKNDDARKAYEKALAEAKKSELNQEFIRMKLNNLLGNTSERESAI